MANDGEDKDLTKINKLFAKQDNLKEGWLKNELLYKAKYDKKKKKGFEKKKRSHIFVPAIRNTVNIINSIFTTAFFGNGCPVEIVPLGEDESDIYTDRKKVLDYYFNKLKPNKELSKAFLSALLYKMGVVITYWDKSKEKVITTSIPITDIAFDDECVNIDDVQCVAYKYYESNLTIKQKIESGIYTEKKLTKKLFKDDNNNDSKRRTVKVLYSLNIKRKYDCKIFIDNTLVSVKEFDNLPFQFGYALDSLPAIDSEKRKDEILCYGGDIPTLLEDLQLELNRKRNELNDIQEMHVTPSLYVGDEAKVKPDRLAQGPGTLIRVGDVNQIKERPIPPQYDLRNDIGMIAGDMQSAVGVNSIQEGQTNASDRRSATALQVVNSNSSMRIELMIMLICETLFEHWAKTWVKLIFKNADDDIINAVTNKKNPFGKKGERDDIAFDLQINFGMTLDKEKKINDLLRIYQMTSQNPNIKTEVIEKMLKKILDLSIGEDTDLSDLFKEVDQDIANREVSQEDIEKQNLANGAL